MRPDNPNFRTAEDWEKICERHVERIAELEAANANCISLVLHESRVANLERQLEELKIKHEQLEGTCQNTFERWQNSMDREVELERQLAEKDADIRQLQSLNDLAQTLLNASTRELTAARKQVGEALEVIEQISKADCPRYMAHPQSVWWSEHVVSKARQFLAEVKK